MTRTALAEEERPQRLKAAPVERHEGSRGEPGGRRRAGPHLHLGLTTPPSGKGFRLATKLGDLAAIWLALEGAARLCVALGLHFRTQSGAEQVAHLVPPAGLVLFTWVIASSWLDLYLPRRGPFRRSALVQVTESVLLVVVLTIVVTFLARDFSPSTLSVFTLVLAVLGAVTMLFNRGLILVLGRLMRRGEPRKERILLVGRSHRLKALISRLDRTARRQVEFCGVVVPVAGEGAGALGNPLPVVGALSDLPALINRYDIDRIIAIEREIPRASLRACVSACARMGVTLNGTAEILQPRSGRVGITEIGDAPFLEMRGAESTPGGEAAKRAFDLVLATLLLLALSPLLLALAALIKLTSAGPVLYLSNRVGRGGRHFRFYKFRSMVADADSRRDALRKINEKGGHLFKLRSDPRITFVGRFMRRFSLDELPQLLNVLKGDMSLVGPRPLPAEDMDPDGLSREYRYWAKERSRIQPGVTGLWQVRGRSSLDFGDLIRLDLLYARNWSLWLDFRILLQTVPAVLKGRGAC